VRAHAKFLGAFALGAVLAAGVAAMAAIPNSKGVIKTCYAKNGGALRVSGSGKCRHGERKLAFNQRGPPGVPGVGQPGQPGTPGTPGQPGAAGRSALEALRPGETIHGVWGLRGNADIAYETVTFPVPAPSAVDSNHAVVAGNDPEAGDGCTGTAAAPVAARGFVCVYAATYSGTNAAGGFGAFGDPTGGGSNNDGSPYGFAIAVQGVADFNINGAWAYTAP
jgi:hypothetical protein